VSYAVLGNGETCTGDPARRAGNEFVFQQLAMENAETLQEAKATKIITTCAHCLNALKNEYPQLGVRLEVVHHTQLLNRLVRDGRLTPVPPPNGSPAGRNITYHDPCYLGRHNEIYEAPRELLHSLPGSVVAEMPRNRERSFCCGAGGARMWMEENIGTRINADRTAEAVQTLSWTSTSAQQGAIATGCPFCRVMLTDGLTAQQADGTAPPSMEVLDVAQLLLESVNRNSSAT
jgi:Fe-S oxidoreductase